MDNNLKRQACILVTQVVEEIYKNLRNRSLDGNEIFLQFASIYRYTSKPDEQLFHLKLRSSKSEHGIICDVRFTDTHIKG